jgi:hypothetical protein
MGGGAPGLGRGAARRAGHARPGVNPWCDARPAGCLNIERTERHHWFARPPSDLAAPERPRYGIAPSKAAEDWADLPPARVTEVVRLGEPLAVSSEGELDWAAVGHAAHDFLAADDPILDPATRAVRADRLLAAHGLAGRIRAEALMDGSDRLRAFVKVRWPEALGSGAQDPVTEAPFHRLLPDS